MGTSVWLNLYDILEQAKLISSDRNHISGCLAQRWKSIDGKRDMDFWRSELFYILIVLVVTQAKTHVKTHRTVEQNMRILLYVKYTVIKLFLIKIYQYFIYLYYWIIFYCMDISPLFICSSISGHLDYFHFWLLWMMLLLWTSVCKYLYGISFLFPWAYNWE